MRATTSRHRGVGTPRRGASWPRFSKPDCVTRAENRAVAARNPSSVPAPELSCAPVESQQHEWALPSPTCWDAQSYRHPTDPEKGSESRSKSAIRLVVKQVLGDSRVAARGGVGQVEDQGEMERVGAGGQCLVQYPVAADAFEVDVLVQQVPLEVFGADGSGSQGRADSKSL